MSARGLLLALTLSLCACTTATQLLSGREDRPFESRNGPVCSYGEDEGDADCEALPVAMQAPGSTRLALHERPDLSSRIVARVAPGEHVSKIDNAFLYYKAHRGVVRRAGPRLRVGEIVYPATPFESDAYPFHEWDDPDDGDYSVWVDGQTDGFGVIVEFNRSDAAQIEWEQLRPKETLEHWILLRRADGSQGWALKCARPPENKCDGSPWQIAETLLRKPGDPGILHVLRGGNIQSAEFSPDDSRVITASRDGVIRVWDTRNGREIASFSGGSASASFSPDGAHIVTANGDGTASVWTLGGGLLLSLRGHAGGAFSAEYSSDGTRILTTGGDNIARIWDAATGQQLLTLTSITSSIEFAAFSPDGVRIGTGSHTGYATEVWDAASGRLVQTLQTEGLGHGIDFSPDGLQIASIGWDTVTVHDAATGREMFKFSIAQKHVSLLSVAYAPDGTKIITGEEQGYARVWDATNGELIFELAPFDRSSRHYRPGPARGIQSVAISSDGSRILTVGRGAAQIWGAN